MFAFVNNKGLGSDLGGIFWSVAFVLSSNEHHSSDNSILNFYGMYNNQWNKNINLFQIKLNMLLGPLTGH